MDTTLTTDNNRVLTTECNMFMVVKILSPVISNSILFQYNDFYLCCVPLPSETPTITTNMTRLCLYKNTTLKAVVSVNFNETYLLHIKLHPTNKCVLYVSGYNNVYPSNDNVLVITTTASPFLFSQSMAFLLYEFIIINGSTNDTLLKHIYLTDGH